MIDRCQTTEETFMGAWVAALTPEVEAGGEVKIGRETVSRKKIGQSNTEKEPDQIPFLSEWSCL
ncbi:hypothetical protein DPMN_173209 [Dreissena polymorpha]|uniref:Uncharacterized protein n=1 Tax=Dreissena polymorpha TaxID=45954 RepID=A0A9D4E3N6_DREPO|nr:hypothetical protein DPMN_173209 [Dreissena polymorpha]